jgi:hypothetical protein
MQILQKKLTQKKPLFTKPVPWIILAHFTPIQKQKTIPTPCTFMSHSIIFCFAQKTLMLGRRMGYDLKAQKT